MAVVGYATIQLIPSLQGFAGSTRSQMAPVIKATGSESGKQAGGLFGNSFLGSVGRIMSAAGIYEIGSRITSGLSDAISTGIKGFADLQTYTISFKTLLGSASAASDMIKNLYSFAAKTPFDVEGSVVGAQKLLGVGVAAKDIIPTLTTLGDSTAALGGSTADFNSVLLAYSQIMARGKVSTQDLYQISNTGIPIFQLLSKALGMPVGQIQKLIETGKLASGDVLPKLLAQMNKDYGGAMTGQAGTLNGLWSTFKDTMSQVLTTALTPVAQYLQDILPGATVAATTAIQWLSDKFGALVAFFQDPNNKFGETFAPLIAELQNTDWEGLLTSIGTAFANLWITVQPVVQGIVDLISNGNLALAAGTLADALDLLFTPIKDNADTVGPKVDSMTDSIVIGANTAGATKQTWWDTASALDLVGGGSINTELGMLKMALAMAKGQSATSAVAGALNGQFGPGLQSASRLTTLFGTSIGIGFSAARTAVTTFVTTTVARIGVWATSIVLTAVGGMTRFAASIGAGAVAAVGAMVRGLAGIATAVAGAVHGALAAIAGFGASFVSAGRALIDGFVRGIVAGIGAARDAAAQVVGAVANFFPHSPAPEGPFSGRGWTLYSGRSLVDGFSKGVQQRQSSLRSLMTDTFTAPTLAGLQGPTSSVAGEVAAATTSRAGTYIGSATVNTTNGNAGVIDDLNFLLRNLNRGGR